jgi:hypothetical protein
LNFQEALGFEDGDHTGQLCGTSLDWLVVRGPLQQRMPITAVRLLNKTKLALLRATYKK